jgi:hypothetical protein
VLTISCLRGKARVVRHRSLMLSSSRWPSRRLFLGVPNDRKFLAFARWRLGHFEGLCTRVALTLLALAAGLVHNQQIGDPGRHFAAYGR